MKLLSAAWQACTQLEACTANFWRDAGRASRSLAGCRTGMNAWHTHRQQGRCRCRCARHGAGATRTRRTCEGVGWEGEDGAGGGGDGAAALAAHAPVGVGVAHTAPGVAHGRSAGRKLSRQCWRCLIAQAGTAITILVQPQSSPGTVGVIRVQAAQTAQGDCTGGEDVTAGPCDSCHERGPLGGQAHRVAGGGQAALHSFAQEVRRSTFWAPVRSSCKKQVWAGCSTSR